ncbi:MAG: CPBP family intramembrane metalloprotease [Oscillospiraceae bacterium]|nr:CPBP family intramembrane metalloprotease [Oscillospiraceae bacterium]
MTDKKKTVRLTVVFIIITYVISGAGYFLWFGKTKAEAAAFIPVLAPSVAGLCVYRKNIRADFLKINIKGIFTGIWLIILCYILAVSMFLISGKHLMKPQIKAPDVVVLFVQWIFAGFCEEFGWRGVLLPLLKKIFTLERACLINGIVWALWHLPLILTANMSKGHSITGGFVLFTITTICLSYIFGLLSESKTGKSIWIYVTIHALYNIAGVILMSMITVTEYKFLDESGYFLVSSLILVTAVLYFVTLKCRRNHD